MNDKQEEPQSLIDLPIKDRVNVMLQRQFIDITDGFPAKSAAELEEILIELLMKEYLGRFPIIGTKDNHIFLLVRGASRS
ncbi:TPA: hypothetical protein DIV55_01430 [Patescibacteria group bacterium]|uniref:Uncharacterized protein n=1 Tax=Candidatus Gottesmanbacteria bacterium GW2011_GWA1_43_11 TaxID=1618436 RepID=A0A0G1FCV8_9BACT|nr:MAG: hypothetical protein UV59_C0015G0021 [Candidatus Gottesmanbacteria bacterium GW2011_GWA1_43_11]HCS78384.1 hypothetical protein [Patescibacteria group bacterium]